VYILFRSEDIPHLVSKSSKNRNVKAFWLPIFGEGRRDFSTENC